MTTALVTGASGFVGSHLARRLLAEGVEVHVLSRPSSDFWRLPDVLAQLLRHEVDLGDAAGLAALLGSIRPDHVFHLAGATVVAGATGGPAELIATNFLGSVNLISACQAAGCKSLVLTGDSFEYTPSRLPLDEASGCQPESLHGITKLAATLYAQAAARAGGSPIVVLRLFSTYGPYDHPRRLVPKVIAAALAGTPIGLSRPEIARDWIYVDDVVDLYLAASRRALELSGRVLNAGTGESGDLARIVDMILRLTGSGAEKRWGQFSAPAHDDYPWIADMGATFAALEWRPRVSLEQGLRKTIEAMRR